MPPRDWRAYRPDRAAVDAGTVIANDRDSESLEMARQNTAEWAQTDPVSPRDILRTCRKRVAEAGFEQVDGLLADLGVSRYQLTEPERGFSFLV